MIEIPRRNDLRRNVEAEMAIRDAIEAVEKMTADVRLTDAVVLLGAALNSVADFIDAKQVRRFVGEEIAQVDQAPDHV